jgi:hypothetical protein
MIIAYTVLIDRICAIVILEGSCQSQKETISFTWLVDAPPKILDTLGAQDLCFECFGLERSVFPVRQPESIRGLTDEGIILNGPCLIILRLAFGSIFESSILILGTFDGGSLTS